MSGEKAKEFLLALKEKGADEAWAAKAAEAKTEEEKYALAADMAREMGYDVTAAELKEALTGLNKGENDLVQLDDDAVEGVAGGSDDGPVNPRSTYCPYCDREDVVAWYTGESRMSWFFFREYAYRCGSCGRILWKF